MNRYCKCEGELEYITETSTLIRGENRLRTIFYECGKCKKLYEEREEQQGRSFFMEIRPYTGLTKEDLIDFAKFCGGEITLMDKLDIISGRK